MRPGDNVEFKITGQTKVNRGILELSPSGTLCITGKDEYVYDMNELDMVQKCSYESEKRNLYRVGAICPHCREEHAVFTIRISDEEQRKMDAYYEEHKNETSLSLLLEDPPIIVKRKLRCPVCEEIFEKFVGVRREDKYEG